MSDIQKECDRLKIVFMGTPEFGATILSKLLKFHEVVLVVTQPDKVVGRKKEIVFSPVKKLALQNDINILQPYKIKEVEEEILKLDFDIIVTAAFGQFVSMRLINYPKYKAINVHGSLLPKYRGGAPIQRSILNGEEETGITIIYMAKKMDAGDMLSKRSIPILETDDADSMFEKLASLGSEMIIEALNDIENNNLNIIAQDENEATFAYNLTKEDELIDFSKTSKDVFNQIRGLSSNPGAYFKIDNNIYKVYSSKIINFDHKEEPGVIVLVTKTSFAVSCGGFSTICFDQIKPEGKKLMNVSDFLNGKGRNIITLNRRVL